MFLGVEYGSISSVVSLVVPGWAALSVTSHRIPGSISLITGAVASVFPGVTSMLSFRFPLCLPYIFSNNLDQNSNCNQTPKLP